MWHAMTWFMNVIQSYCLSMSIVVILPYGSVLLRPDTVVFVYPFHQRVKRLYHPGFAAVHLNTFIFH